MTKDKVCPMKFGANKEVISSGYICEEENCAWWSQSDKCCSVLNIGSIPYVLDDIQRTLIEGGRNYL